ncbi:Het-C-domain-containing protein [Wallemia mellicola CBS 633.66]|uniref:Het-C-domain-containing protein n=1 Tax=Wallemia mellicola (strain ATCC MYA-4683 / CBS 633.66) TaxID=671144 RepID=I4YFF2_WALMC|nr:Het-C-domain-containing protein [Wallemia mellicola CBS 633.66]EIM22694.1 Het-C-domain-containing protein [Wallemia mellicola CBS 633.66]|eukprot:XP_006957358.1 Het-C-domain-containing protein [Wallemia mellicola CBS 633.66]
MKSTSTIHLDMPMHQKVLQTKSVVTTSFVENYIANEDGEWDTSSEFIRKNLVACVELGRRARQDDNDEQMWEALRLLGTALHTLEDYAAHSNFIEVALQSLGYENVFTHVGENVRFDSPNGKKVSPIVTGTFGGLDFFHSMCGEVSDKLSSNGVGDLSTKLSQSKDSNVDNIRKIITKLLKSKDKGEKDDSDDGHADADQKVNRLEEIRKHAKDNTNMNEDEFHSMVMEVLTIHDDITRAIEAVMDKIPFINELLDEASNTLQVFIYSTIEPVLSPILKNLKDAMFEVSAGVIDDHSQRIVFNDPNASDPTHSMLAKDHFGNILNGPAGRLAKVVITHAVNTVVKDGWDGDRDPRSIADDCIQALHHPDFQNGSQIQKDMVNFVKEWIESQGNEKNEVLKRLEKDSVLEHRNTTDNLSGGSAAPNDQEKYGQYHGARQGLQGLAASGTLDKVPGGKELSEGMNALHMGGADKNMSVERSKNNSSGHQSGNQHPSGKTQHQSSGYGGGSTYGSSGGYGGSGNDHSSGRHQQSSGYGSTGGYGGSGNDHSSGRHQQSSGYGSTGGYGGSGNDHSSGRHQQSSGYGGGSTYGSSGGYGGSGNDYSSGRHQQSSGYGGGYGESGNTYGSSSHGSNTGYGSSNTHGSSYGLGGDSDQYTSRNGGSYRSGNEYGSGQNSYGSSRHY